MIRALALALVATLSTSVVAQLPIDRDPFGPPRPWVPKNGKLDPTGEERSVRTPSDAFARLMRRAPTITKALSRGGFTQVSYGLERGDLLLLSATLPAPRTNEIRMTLRAPDGSIVGSSSEARPDRLILRASQTGRHILKVEGASTEAFGELTVASLRVPARPQEFEARYLDGVAAFEPAGQFQSRWQFRYVRAKAGDLIQAAGRMSGRSGSPLGDDVIGPTGDPSDFVDLQLQGQGRILARRPGDYYLVTLEGSRAEIALAYPMPVTLGWSGAVDLPRSGLRILAVPVKSGDVFSVQVTAGRVTEHLYVAEPIPDRPADMPALRFMRMSAGPLSQRWNLAHAPGTVFVVVRGDDPLATSVQVQIHDRPPTLPAFEQASLAIFESRIHALDITRPELFRIFLLSDTFVPELDVVEASTGNGVHLVGERGLLNTGFAMLRPGRYVVRWSSTNAVAAGKFEVNANPMDRRPIRLGVWSPLDESKGVGYYELRLRAIATYDLELNFGVKAYILNDQLERVPLEARSGGQTARWRFRVPRDGVYRVLATGSDERARVRVREALVRESTKG